MFSAKPATSPRPQPRCPAITGGSAKSATAVACHAAVVRRPSFLRRSADPKAALKAHYEARRKEPIDDKLAVFAAYWNRGYACNPAAIHRALPLPTCAAVWVVKRDAADKMPEGVEFVHPATRGVLRPDRAREVLRQQRQLAQQPRQARGPGARDDPPRHAAQADGPRPARGRRPREDRRLRGVHAARRALGLLDRRQPVLHARVEQRLRGRVVRRRWRPATRATTCSPTPTPEDVRRARARARPRRTARSPCSTPRRTASTRPTAASCSTSPRWPGCCPATTSCWRGSTTLRRAGCGARRPGARRLRPPVGRGAVPRRRRARHRLLLDHVRLRRARQADRHPRARLGDLRAQARARTSTCWPSRPGAVTTTAIEVADGAAAKARRDRELLGGVPRALLRAGGRPRERAGRGEGLRRVSKHLVPRRRRRAARARACSPGSSSQLGFRIPQPEVKADDTNPKGFGEPKWVVDFHTRIMRRKRVTVFDARPKAWELTRETTEQRRRRTCARGCSASWRAPRRSWSSRTRGSSWFLPLWTEAARELGRRDVVRDDAAPPGADPHQREEVLRRPGRPTPAAPPRGST